MLEHILIIKHGALGDLIQSMGILRDIRAHYPQAQLTLLTSPAYADLLQGCPYVDRVWLDDRHGGWRQIQRRWQLLRDHDFHTLIDLQNSDRSRWYGRAWYLDQWCRRLTRWQHRVKPRWVARAWYQPAPDSGLRGLEVLMHQHGIACPHARDPDLRWLIQDFTRDQAQFELPKHYIVLIPGASRQHPNKRWPYYAQLSQYFYDQGIAHVVVLGPDELSLASRFSGQVLSGLSWQALALVLAYAEYVIANDTGPAHMAAHLGVKGLALFGPTSANRSEMRTPLFSTWQVTDLNTLTVNTVLTKIAPYLPLTTLLTRQAIVLTEGECNPHPRPR